MRRKIFIGIAFLVAAVAETSFLPNLAWRHMAPDLVLVGITFWFFENDFKKIWPWIFTAGLFLDILSFMPVGLNAFSFLLIFAGVDFLARKFFMIQKRGNFLIFLSVVLGVTIIYSFFSQFIFFTIKNFSTAEAFFRSFTLIKLFLKILGNLAVATILFWFLPKLKKFFYQENTTIIF